MSRRSRLSRTSRAPSRLIRPRPIDCDRGSEQPMKIFPRFLANFLFEQQQVHRHRDRKNKVFIGYWVYDLHPKRSPYPDFRDRGAIFRATKGGQNKIASCSWRGELVSVGKRVWAFLSTVINAEAGWRTHFSQVFFSE